MRDPTVSVKRVYDAPEEGDGVRVLVDRLWPRGVRKDDLRLARWARELAPSTELRRWYGHDPSRFDEFRRRYERELDDPEIAGIIGELAAAGRRGRLTLLTATRDLERSGARVLADILQTIGG
jgi:uncharacterized protein YeaO (DUF488 family)